MNNILKLLSTGIEIFKAKKQIFITISVVSVLVYLAYSKHYIPMQEKEKKILKQAKKIDGLELDKNNLKETLKKLKDDLENSRFENNQTIQNNSFIKELNNIKKEQKYDEINSSVGSHSTTA